MVAQHHHPPLISKPATQPKTPYQKMKQKLIEMLDLKPAADQTEVTDEQVIFAVAHLQSQLLGHHNAAAYEKAITDLIVESCGALNRETAKEVLAQRKREAAANAAK
jgi:hypothetical protein